MGIVIAEITDLLEEFMRFNVFAQCQDTKVEWNEFVTTCNNEHETRQLSAKILILSRQYHFESELMNHIFVNQRNDAINVLSKANHVYQIEISLTNKAYL